MRAQSRSMNAIIHNPRATGHNGVPVNLGRPLGIGKPAGALLALLLLLTSLPGQGAETLNWDSGRNRVSADIKSGKLYPLLEQIASASGWRVFIEPGLECSVSAKFQGLPPGEALRLLLGDISFALV